MNVSKSRSIRDFHVPSHRSLADPRRIPARPAVGEYPSVVVVPATRTRGTLGHAAGVARMAGCPLVIICSKGLTPELALAELEDEVLPRWVLAVSLEDQHEMTDLNLETSRFHTVADQRCDTSDKRNLAILAALRLDWDRILFLDDDVAGLGRTELDDMAYWMAQSNRDGQKIEAVGWAFSRSSETHTADNSVVCHAYRSTGEFQDSFIGAGGLMVRCGDRIPFFPKIYNEDWLFLLPALAAGRVILAGELSQTNFDPFHEPSRARREEFGDVLAEGLYTLLHCAQDGMGSADPMPTIWDYGKNAYWWAGVVERRRRFIDLVQAKLRAKRMIRQAVFDSLQAAKGAVRNSWSDLLSDFVIAWHKDLTAWELKVGDLRANRAPGIESDLQSIEKVFRELGMSGAQWLTQSTPARREPFDPAHDSALAAVVP